MTKKFSGKFWAIAIAFCSIFYIGVSIPNTSITIRITDLVQLAIIIWSGYLIITQRIKIRDKVWLVGMCWLLAIVLSLLVACVIDGSLYMKGWMKAYRQAWLFTSMLPFLLKKVDGEFFIKCVLNFGTIEAVFSVFMWILQIPVFCAWQTVHHGGAELYRAGGFVDDAASFSQLCVFLIVISLFYLIKKEIRISAAMCLLSNSIALFAADTRTLIITCFLGVFISLLMMIKKGHVYRGVNSALIIWNVLGIVIIIWQVLVMLGIGNEITIWRDIASEARRVGSFTNKVNDVLSERVFIWGQYLDILQKQKGWNWLCGYGHFITADKLNVYTWAAGKKSWHRSPHNMYIRVLVETGIIGWCTFIALFRVLLIKIKKRLESVQVNICFVLCICCFVIMLFDDALTMVNSAALIFVFYSMSGEVLGDKKNSNIL